MNWITRGILVIAALSLSMQVSAKIYKWVDSNGKVHFSDKPPKQAQTSGVKDLSGKLRSSNIDSSGAEAQRLRKVFPAETAIEKQRRQQQKQANQQRQQLKKKQQQYCQKLRKNYRTMQGRFYYVHPDGSTSDIKESERKKVLADMQDKIRRHCG